MDVRIVPANRCLCYYEYEPPCPYCKGKEREVVEVIETEEDPAT